MRRSRNGRIIACAKGCETMEGEKSSPRHNRLIMEQMQGILSKSKYFDVLGSLVNFCLTSVMDDILAIPDITEVESHRLSELCRILHALEGLFVDDPEQVRCHVFATLPVHPCRYSLPLLLGVSRRGSNSHTFPSSW